MKNSPVDKYISVFPQATQKRLQEIRHLIKETAPEATELISYKMPAYKLDGMLVYFAGHTEHIGFYPTTSGIDAFKNDLASYTHAKGSIQFPLSEPLPTDLISKIVKFRVEENQSKAASKQVLKTCTRGHKFYKSSDCPVCPICWPGYKRRLQNDFPQGLSAPALRALHNAKINTLADLSKHTIADVLKLHGMGPASIPRLTQALKSKSLAFKS